MRLDKYLAESSIGTRKIVRGYINAGKVKVNGEVVTEAAMEINKEDDIIEYLDEVVTYSGKIYYMFHKPAGCITARKDEVYETVLDYFKEVDTNGLFPVGRLDKDTEGLLFLTNDGEFDHQLMSPHKHVEKTYYFWALGSISEEDKCKLEQGVCIGDTDKLTKPAVLTLDKWGTFKEFESIIDCPKSQYMKEKRYDQPVVSGYLTISEGQKHQVKRMLRAIGCYVVYLKRISIGEVLLDESLEKGQYRLVTEDEINKLLMR